MHLTHWWLRTRSAVFLAAACVPILPLPAADAAETSLTVVTYNLRFASNTKPNAWPDRRPVMIDCVRRMDPDLMGTQEGVYEQLRELAAGLPDHTWLGQGRDGGSHGEFMAVFYRKERFDPLEYGHFWLSDTPAVVGSRTWDHTNPRMVTWVRFLDRRTQRAFYFFNTHLDHAVQAAREKGAELIAQRVAALNTHLPILLTGDFNAASGDNRAYDILVQPDRFQDTWHLAQSRKGEDLGTFNGFRDVPRDGRRIDWILLRGKAVVTESEVIPFRQGDQFPSDHFPVLARLRWE